MGSSGAKYTPVGGSISAMRASTTRYRGAPPAQPARACTAFGCFVPGGRTPTAAARSRPSRSTASRACRTRARCRGRRSCACPCPPSSPSKSTAPLGLGRHRARVRPVGERPREAVLDADAARHVADGDDADDARRSTPATTTRAAPRSRRRAQPAAAASPTATSRQSPSDVNAQLRRAPSAPPWVRMNGSETKYMRPEAGQPEQRRVLEEAAPGAPTAPVTASANAKSGREVGRASLVARRRAPARRAARGSAARALREARHLLDAAVHRPGAK